MISAVEPNGPRTFAFAPFASNASNTAGLPLAFNNGVEPSVAALFGSARLASRSLSAGNSPPPAASNRGVSPLLPCMFTFAPLASNASMVAMSPFRAAASKGLFPFSIAPFGSAPDASRAFTCSEFPEPAALTNSPVNAAEGALPGEDDTTAVLQVTSQLMPNDMVLRTHLPSL